MAQRIADDLAVRPYSAEVPTTSDPRLQVVGRVGSGEHVAVSELVRAAAEADGVPPLSEHATLHLRYGGAVAVRHVLRWVGNDLVAYAQLDATDPVAGASAEVVVAPAHRRRGHGRAVLGRLLAECPDGRLRLWAHGAHPGSAALAASLGLVQVRELWQLRRSLMSRLPDVALPPGVALRTFRPGGDDEAWVALNAAAFADHPEQGALTLDDLHRRMQEPWFDPEGFFLAERAGALVGFHWTKVHGGGGHGHDPIGEVYVVGVGPSARGTGLGRVLTVVGLRHLRAQGLPAAILYVDADNTAAVALYTSLGFTRWGVDVMFSVPAASPRMRP